MSHVLLVVAVGYDQIFPRAANLSPREVDGGVRPIRDEGEIVAKGVSRTERAGTPAGWK